MRLALGIFAVGLLAAAAKRNEADRFAATVRAAEDAEQEGAEAAIAAGEPPDSRRIEVADDLGLIQIFGSMGD